MFSSIFSRSKWIWPLSNNWDLHNGYALFRKDFQLEAIPKSAPLFITADQSYQLYVNGHYVCRGPARGLQKSWPFDEVDIQPYLRIGRNVFAIRAYNPGFGNYQYVSEGYAGLLLAARWNGVGVVSNLHWKARRQNGIRRDTVPASQQLFPQEHIDLRLEDPDWADPEFDDSCWSDLLSEHIWNGMPWPELQERGIPLLDERLWSGPLMGVGTAKGKSGAGYCDTRDIARLRYEEGLAHDRKAFPANEFCVPAVAKGHFYSVLIDFGKIVVGRVGFKVSGATGGEIIDTLHVETVEAGCPDYFPDKHSRMAFGHRMICRPGEQTYTFYHPFGFRYMVVTVRRHSSELTISPHLRTTVYPYEGAGSFQSSDYELQRIWEICEWTQRVCSLDAYVDTPWREQAQWWGDARVQGWNTFHLSGDTRLFRRGIAQIAAMTAPCGLTYGHAPTIGHKCILPDFSLIWILTVWDFYWQTGSLEPFETHYSVIVGILDYFRGSRDAGNGLCPYDPRFWLFLDWADIYREGYPIVLNLWLLLALERTADLHHLQHKAHEAEQLRNEAAILRKAIGRLVDSQGLLRDGYDAQGVAIPSTSVHAQTLALMAGISPCSEAAILEQVLLPFIREEREFSPRPSAYWITYVFSELQKRGYTKEVLAYIRKYWVPMIPQGSTWETFSPNRGDWSFSHAWSAHPLYHLMQTVGGITQTSVGWKTIHYAPIIAGDSAETIVPTPFGPIHSKWKRTPDGIEITLSLPEGVTANAVVGEREEYDLRGSLQWLIPDSN